MLALKVLPLLLVMYLCLSMSSFKLQRSSAVLFSSGNSPLTSKGLDRLVTGHDSVQVRFQLSFHKSNGKNVRQYRRESKLRVGLAGLNAIYSTQAI